MWYNLKKQNEVTLVEENKLVWVTLVINVNNYIGNSTNLEIEYAKKLGKEIIYYTDIIENN